MKLAHVLIGAALLLFPSMIGSVTYAEPEEGEGGQALTALPEQCTPQVDCGDVKDAKLHMRSGKSYWGIATKTRPPDEDVLAKCENQLELAYCKMPEHWELNMFLGMAKAEFGQFECSGYFFQRSIELADSKKHRKQAAENRAHYWVEQYNEALDLYNEGAYALASEKAKIAVQIDGTDCRGFTILGSAYANEQKYAEAILMLEQGLDLCPEKDTLRDNLYAAYHNRGNEIFNQASSAEEFAEAVEYYKKADAIQDNELGNLYYLGAACLQMVQRGDTTAVDCARDAIGRFIEYSETDEDRKFGLYSQGLLSIETEDWEAANATAEAYIDVAPLEADGYALKSRAMVKMGQAQEAEIFIVLTNCLREEPIADVATWCEAAKTNYGVGSELAKFINANGCPQQVWVYTDSSEKDMVVVVYEQQGKAFAYYDGELKGDRDVKFDNP